MPSSIRYPLSMRQHIRTYGPLLAAFLLVSSTFAAGTVHVISLDASINPATADYISQSILRAHKANAEALVIRLNTPGGLLKSTREIVRDILSAPLPVVVYVAPSGSQAASAGTFITLAAHVAAMAPGTNIGAAHPVGMQGGEPDSIMNAKATNDAAAFIRSISEKRKRNVQWAEEAVRRSLSITENEALEKNVIDVVAENVNELLSKIDSLEVEVNGSKQILNTKDAEVIMEEMDWKHSILDILSDPNIAYILLMLGMYGLLFELYNPGSLFPGVVGAIALILGLYSLHTLPINYAGLALIILAIILFILEIKVTSYGMLTVAGVVCLFLGSVMLIDSESSLEFISISWGVIIPTIVVTVLFFVFALAYGIRAQTRKPTTGEQGLLGERGEAISLLNPEGQVRVHGEIWNASTVGGKIAKGTTVVVTKVDGLRVHVKKQES
ncbi:MAG TPA: nodulation protein NfeD [Bacteroidota bacterium]